jgi:hypothetical protein
MSYENENKKQIREKYFRQIGVGGGGQIFCLFSLKHVRDMFANDYQ